MILSGSYEVEVPRERAYALLQDPEILAQCMPGCDELVKIGEDEYEMKMKLSLASLSGAFSGKVRIADQQPPDSFRLLVEGKGRLGFMSGDGLLKLEPNQTGSVIHYQGDVQVGGTMASVGQRLIDSSAKMIIKRFFSKFSSLAQETAA